MCQLRHRGVAAAVICSEPFVRLAKSQAAVAGVPDLPLIIIPHPLGGATLDVVKKRAEVAYEQLTLLVQDLLR